MSRDDLVEVDCRGMRCPGPVIELARAIAEVPVGGFVGPGMGPS